MGRNINWQNFLDAIAVNQKDDATAAMQDMARSIKRKNVRDTAAFMSMPVPAYIQDQVNSEQARSRAETAAYRDRLAAEAHMHPLDRPSLDRSCNPNLSVYEWMRERGD